MKIYKKLTLASVLGLLITPVVTLAGPNNWVVRTIDNSLSMVVWPIFIGLVIIMFIWAGILYLTAHGDPEKFKKANLAVVFAIIGIIVAILGYKIIGTITRLIPPAPGSVQLNGACTEDIDCAPPASRCVVGICR